MKLQKTNIMLQWLTIAMALVAMAMILLGLTVGKAGSTYSFIMCICVIPIALIPYIVKKLFNIGIPEFIKTYFFIYVICGSLLGAVFNFYTHIPFWDKIMHAASGVLWVVSALIVFERIGKVTELKMNKTMKLLFAFSVTLALGVIWEFIEFGFDVALNINMQSYMTADGTPIAGQAALLDTMIDLLLSTAGAAISCLFLAFSKEKLPKQIAAAAPEREALPSQDDLTAA